MNVKTILKNARDAVKESGLSYLEIGLRMGHPRASARQSVSQFLRGNNPSVRRLLRFAKALGVDAKDLL